MYIRLIILILLSPLYSVVPVIDQPPLATSVLAPDPVTLTCIASGQPAPEVVWIKDSGGSQTEYSVSGDGVEISTVQSTTMSTSTFTISSTGPSDTANYSCKAGNILGNTTSQAAEVTVFGE